MSIFRYYAILHPIRAKCVSTVALAKKTILVLWILSLVMASPILVGRVSIVHLISNYSERCGKYCGESGKC